MQYISVYMLWHYLRLRQMFLCWRWYCTGSVSTVQSSCCLLLQMGGGSSILSKCSMANDLALSLYLYFGFIMIALSVFRCRRPSSWQMRMLRWSLCGLPCGAALWYPKKSMRDVNVVSPSCLGNHRYVISNNSCLIRVIFNLMSFYSCYFIIIFLTL